MSASTEPYAKGYGILLGIILLWVVSYGLMKIGAWILGAVVGGEG